MVAIICLLLAIPNIVFAQDFEAVPYIRVCGLCHNRMTYETYTYYETVTVLSCSNLSSKHTHRNEIQESGFLCATFGCAAEGFYLDKTQVVDVVCPYE